MHSVGGQRMREILTDHHVDVARLTNSDLGLCWAEEISGALLMECILMLALDKVTKRDV
jgi:hypothetical protein